MESVRDRLRCVIEEIEDWKHLGFGAEENEEGGAPGVKEEEEEAEEEVEGDGEGEMEDEEMEAL